MAKKIEKKTEDKPMAKPKLTDVILLKNPSCLGEILCRPDGHEKRQVEIIATIQLPWSKFLAFGDHLDVVYDWLANKTNPGKAVNVIPPYGRYRKMHIVVIADSDGKPQFAGIKTKE